MISVRYTQLASWAASIALVAILGGTCLAAGYGYVGPAATPAQRATSTPATPATQPPADYVYFSPLAPSSAADTGWRGSGQYNLPPKVGGVTVEVVAAANRTADSAGATVQTFAIRLGITARGTQAVSLDPATARLYDEPGHLLVGATAYSGNRPVTADTIGPGGSDTVQLEFALPSTMSIETLGNVTVEWPYTYGGQTYVAHFEFAPYDTSGQGSAVIMPSPRDSGGYSIVTNNYYSTAPYETVPLYNYSPSLYTAYSDWWPYDSWGWGWPSWG